MLSIPRKTANFTAERSTKAHVGESTRELNAVANANRESSIPSDALVKFVERRTAERYVAVVMEKRCARPVQDPEEPTYVPLTELCGPYSPISELSVTATDPSGPDPEACPAAASGASPAAEPRGDQPCSETLREVYTLWGECMFSEYMYGLPPPYIPVEEFPAYPDEENDSAKRVSEDDPRRVGGYHTHNPTGWPGLKQGTPYPGGPYSLGYPHTQRSEVRVASTHEQHAYHGAPTPYPAPSPYPGAPSAYPGAPLYPGVPLVAQGYHSSLQPAHSAHVTSAKVFAPQPEFQPSNALAFNHNGHPFPSRSPLVHSVKPQAPGTPAEYGQAMVFPCHGARGYEAGPGVMSHVPGAAPVQSEIFAPHVTSRGLYAATPAAPPQHPAILRVQEQEDGGLAAPPPPPPPQASLNGASQFTPRRPGISVAHASRWDTSPLVSPPKSLGTAESVLRCKRLSS